MNKKRAFSLIELSVVILIIGILIAGVTQSSRLISAMKLASAKSLTQSAPVNSIRNLVFWFEPTLEESFPATLVTDDDAQITQWNDINPQSSQKYYAVKSTSSEVVYKNQGINGIPSISFSGASSANGFFKLSPTTSVLDAINLNFVDNKFTIFIVSKLATSGDSINRFLFYNGDPSFDGYGYFRSSTNTRAILFGGLYVGESTAASITTDPEVLSLTYAGNDGIMSLYINGATEAIADFTGRTMVMPLTTYFAIGGNSGNIAENFNGLISEVIIFERLLKTEERQAVERYLGKKYAIQVL